MHKRLFYYVSKIKETTDYPIEYPEIIDLSELPDTEDIYNEALKISGYTRNEVESNFKTKFEFMNVVKSIKRKYIENLYKKYPSQISESALSMFASIHLDSLLMIREKGFKIVYIVDESISHTCDCIWESEYICRCGMLTIVTHKGTRFEYSYKYRGDNADEGNLSSPIMESDLIYDGKYKTHPRIDEILECEKHHVCIPKGVYSKDAICGFRIGLLYSQRIQN